jgi:hypothetical protein
MGYWRSHQRGFENELQLVRRERELVSGQLAGSRYWVFHGLGVPSTLKTFWASVLVKEEALEITGEGSSGSTAGNAPARPAVCGMRKRYPLTSSSLLQCMFSESKHITQEPFSLWYLLFLTFLPLSMNIKNAFDLS